MMQQEIFNGLNLTEKEAFSLAIYWKYAGNTIGIIDEIGYLTTSKGIWERPFSRNEYKILRKAFEKCDCGFVKVSEDTISIDFRELSYKIAWVQNLIDAEHLKVRDSKEGLLLFKKKKTRTEWYGEVYWPLQGVKTEMLQLNHKSVVSVSEHPENPDEADWAELLSV